METVEQREFLDDLLSVIRPIITSLKILEEALGEEIDALPAPTATPRLQLVTLACAREEDGDDAC